MKKILKLITLTAIGVAVKVALKNKSYERINKGTFSAKEFNVLNRGY